MKQHTSLNRSRMLDWLRDLEERDEPAPTDSEIAERFGFDSPEAARTLLADLADRAEIVIKGTGAERTIKFGRTRTSYAHTTVVPAPAVRRPTTSTDDGVQRILEIVKRGKQKKLEPVAKPPVERPTPTPRTEARTATVPPPAPVSPAPSGPTRQAAFRITAAEHAQLSARAEAEDSSVSAVCQQIVRSVLAGQDPTPEVRLERKPVIRAAMVTAAQEAGIPLDAFVRLLIERGFESFMASRPEAEAA